VAVASAGRVCKSTPCSRQSTTPAPHHSVFYRPDALPAAQPSASSTEDKAEGYSKITNNDNLVDAKRRCRSAAGKVTGGYDRD